MTLQIWFEWPDGRTELRYERVAGSREAQTLIAEVDALHAAAELGGYVSPYTYCHVQEGKPK